MNNANSLALESLVLAIQEQREEIKSLAKTIQCFNTSSIPAWVDLKTAALLKGIGTQKALQRKPWQQPCCGTSYKKANGHRVWTRDQIIEWLSITDDELENYADKYQVDISKYFRNGKNLNNYGENNV